MALDFPSSPVDGQISGNYIYSSSSGAWKGRPQYQQTSTQSPAAPTSPNAGDIWVDTTDGSSFYWYDDGTSKQWVEFMTSGIPSTPVAVANGGTASTTRGAAGLVPVVASSTARDAIYPSPIQGDSVWRSDKGYTERYRAAYNASTNPGGMVVAGWYPDGPITARFWIPDHTANPTGSFTMSLDSTKSSPLASNLFSVSGATVTLRNPGVYSMWYRIRSSSVASSTRAFFGIQISDLFLNGTSTIIDAGFRTSIENSGEDSDHVSATYTANSAGVTALFSTYSSVSASYSAGVAAITYLGPIA